MVVAEVRSRFSSRIRLSSAILAFLASISDCLLMLLLLFIDMCRRVEVREIRLVNGGCVMYVAVYYIQKENRTNMLFTFHTITQLTQYSSRSCSNMSDFEDSDIRYSYDSPLRSDGNTSISRGFRGSSVTAHTSPPPSSDIDDIINNTGATAFRNPGTSHRDNGGYIGAESHKFGLDPIDPADDLQKLKQAWVSERTAPELLPFVQEIVDRVMGRIRKQIEYIEINSMNMTAAPDAKLKLLIVETDLERVKFVLRGYLRARLLKVSSIKHFQR